MGVGRGGGGAKGHFQRGKRAKGTFYLNYEKDKMKKKRGFTDLVFLYFPLGIYGELFKDISMLETVQKKGGKYVLKLSIHPWNPKR